MIMGSGPLRSIPLRSVERVACLRWPFPLEVRVQVKPLCNGPWIALCLLYQDWVEISSMFLGPPPKGFTFVPKHASNAYYVADS